MIPNFIHQEYIERVVLHRPMIPIHTTQFKSKRNIDTHLKCIHNNGTRPSLKMLLCFKQIIAKQLPNMPKGYISKVVFDGRHESMVIEGEGRVIGGACFRCFEGKVFV